MKVIPNWSLYLTLRSTVTLSLKGARKTRTTLSWTCLEKTEACRRQRTRGRTCPRCLLWYRTNLLPAAPEHTSIAPSCSPSSKHLTPPRQEIWWLQTHIQARPAGAAGSRRAGTRSREPGPGFGGIAPNRARLQQALPGRESPPLWRCSWPMALPGTAGVQNRTLSLCGPFQKYIEVISPSYYSPFYF